MFLTAAQVVDGNRFIHTPYDLSFRVERDHTVLCNKELTQKELEKFRKVGGLRVPGYLSCHLAHQGAQQQSAAHVYASAGCYHSRTMEQYCTAYCGFSGGSAVVQP